MIAATPRHFAALLAGSVLPDGLAPPSTPVASSEVLQMLANLACAIESDFAPAAWLVVCGDRVAGLCSLVKPPENRTVTIGYGIAPGDMRQGHATRAVAALLDWARADDRVDVMLAETAETNIASQKVLLASHFVRSGSRTDDEDGALLCWRHDLD
ncbi:MAG: GNAT family N-acetyltransferase [Sphingomonadales bacterium]|nr:GNAT family N-acetyltransferase [Sphingomonadales bacterium]